MSQYADSQSIVSTEWLFQHGADPNVALIEVASSRAAYDEGHIPGALFWNWQSDLADPIRRDVVGPMALEALLSRSGIVNNTIIILYGGENNAYAAWAFWQLRLHGHRDTRILNGNREKWIAEGRALSTELTVPAVSAYRSRALNSELRALLPLMKLAFKNPHYVLVDVRSHDEFTGAATVSDRAGVSVRSGHIPGARHVPCESFCREDGTFRSVPELQSLFEATGVTPDKEVITYCRVGERASLAWYVLKHLLGYPLVKNYDGSWAEWGNLIGVAIEQGDERPLRPPRLVHDSDH